MITRAPGPISTVVVLALAWGAAGCAAPTSMGGFGERDARVAPAPPAMVDACTVRTGQLVIEVERVVINEYPHHDPTSAHAQQPLLVRSLFSDGQAERDGDVQAWVSPMRYRAGQTVSSFAALRLLERPLRALAGKHVVVRLAENDRTSPGSWNHVAEAAGGAAGATGALGVPVPPSSVVQEGVHLLAKLDRDDLILLWSIDADALIAAVAVNDGSAAGATPAARAARFALSTPRRAPGGATPSATAEIVVYRQPEAGCP